jgi:hypothetical protein
MLSLTLHFRSAATLNNWANRGRQKVLLLFVAGGKDLLAYPTAVTSDEIGAWVTKRSLSRFGRNVYPIIHPRLPS